MVIDKIDVESLSVFKAKNDPPIGADSYRVKTFQLSLQRMQPKRWDVHPFNFLRGMEGGQNKRNARQHVLGHFAAVVILEETPQSFVLEAFYHGLIVNRKFTFYKYFFCLFPDCSSFCLMFAPPEGM